MRLFPLNASSPLGDNGLMRRALVPALLLLLACVPAAEGPFFEVEEALGRAISQTPGATGGAVAIHRGEQVVFESAGGRVRAGLGAKVVGPETLFKMESVSKTVAALTALQLVKEGKLSLDARLSDVMPGWTLERSPENAAELTVRNLLQHTTGLDDTSDYQPTAEGSEEVVEQEMPKALVSVVKPGAVRLYSNRGFWILGRVLERAGGRPYRELAQALVLDRLGMERSALSLRDARARGMADQLEASFFLDSVPAVVGEAAPFSLASEALYSNVREYPRVLRALAQPGVLSDELRAEVTRNPSPMGQVGEGWGLGVEVWDSFPLGDGRRARVRALMHTGGFIGATAYAIHFPDQDVSVVAMVNGRGAPLRQVIEAAMRVMNLTDSIEAAPAPELSDAYVGRYENAFARDRFQMKWIEVTRNGDTFEARGERGDLSLKGSLKPQEKDVFLLDGGLLGTFRVGFVRGPDGQPRYLVSDLFALTRREP
jgi:CubicO group peptidase (beta-lactamase class C family)